MTLSEANQLLAETDCGDPAAAAAALSERARAIVELAAVAPPELLRETLASGERFRRRLEAAQIEADRELDRMMKLSRGLETNLDSRARRGVSCVG